MIRRAIHDELLKRLKEKRRFLQVLAGPRQAGKTTLVRQVMAASHLPAHYASADEPTLRGDRTWLEQQWDIARLKAGEGKSGALLVLDEIQKITDWPNVVKLLWDADTHSGVALKVVLLGSAPLLIQSGLTESLAGRFEVIAVPHWSLTEMREAFGWNLEQYIFYGAYPGAAGLIDTPERWRRYILDSLIETTISRDILSLTRVDKPALLRRLFLLGCAYSGQILSYQKMIGQLTDAGNTTTLAHYLELLQGAGMMAGLTKYSHGPVASARVQPQTASAQYRPDERPGSSLTRGSQKRRRPLGTVGGIRCRRALVQFQLWHQHQRRLLARTQPRSGFCLATGQGGRRD